MEDTISKELLSGVLGFKVEWFNIAENCVYIRLDEAEELNINIHELAHECILYAWDDFCEITPRVMGAEITCLKTGCTVHTIDAEEIEKPEKFDPRYTFKACEWILNNKVKRVD